MGPVWDEVRLKDPDADEMEKVIDDGNNGKPKLIDGEDDMKKVIFQRV